VEIFPYVLNILLLSFLACMISDEKFAVIFIFNPLLVMCFFPWIISRFSLCFWLSTLNIILLGIGNFGVLMLGVACSPWIYALVSVINFGNFSIIITFNISFTLFFLSSSSNISSMYIWYLLKLSHTSWMFYCFFSFFFFPFCT